MALPLAFDIHRHHVVNAKQFSQPISGNVVLVRVHEVHFRADAKLLYWFVFINGLKVGVVRKRAVAERKPPRVRDTFRGRPTVRHLGGEKELLSLLLAQGWLVRSNGEERASQPQQRGKYHLAPAQTKGIHRRHSSKLRRLY